MPFSEGMPRQPSRCQLSVRENHGALNPTPNPRARHRSGTISVRRSSPATRPSPSGVACGQPCPPLRDSARPRTGTTGPQRRHHPRTQPNSPLTQPHSFRDAASDTIRWHHWPAYKPRRGRSLTPLAIDVDVALTVITVGRLLTRGFTVERTLRFVGCLRLLSGGAATCRPPWPRQT
jgi:hypothetical protein